MKLQPCRGLCDRKRPLQKVWLYLMGICNCIEHKRKTKDWPLRIGSGNSRQKQRIPAQQ